MSCAAGRGSSAWYSGTLSASVQSWNSTRSDSHCWYLMLVLVFEKTLPKIVITPK
jgi:hypothetical protein